LKSVTGGSGFTVTVMANAVPVHEPVFEMGVTIYCTVPAELSEFVNTSLIDVPEPGFAPVIFPVIVPTVHEKLLGTLAVKLTFTANPLQTDAEAAVVTAGNGVTVTVIVKADPTHEPSVDVGVILYCTVPFAVWLVLFNMSLIVVPEPAVAPVIPPVMVPTVHVKVLGVFAVKLIFGPVPLHVLAVEALVTVGVWFVMIDVLFPDMALEQPGVEPDARFVTVKVVEPLLANEPVVKFPVPAVATFIVALRPLA
jgi:hypothetical protein